jgi:hypothetical protein
MPISIISRTNTIDEWRVQTNQAATSLNTLETGNYVKSNGTLTLSSNSSLLITANGTALQVSNNALVQGNVSIGRNLSITQNLDVTQGVTIGSGLNVTSGIVVLPTLNLNDTNLVMNANFSTGAPVGNASLIVRRGSSSNTVLRWNETSDKWEFTNDGSSYGDIAAVSQVLSAGSYANSGFLKANSAETIALSSGSYANSSFIGANTADQRAVISGVYANAAYGQANTATTNAATADQRAVTSGSYANGAFTFANTRYSSSGGLINGAVQVGGNITPASNNTLNIGNTTNRFANVHAITFIGTATTAQYADLAEKYTTDNVYPVGTVIIVNTESDSEATKSTSISQLVLGVISENPAYLMNSESTGQAIALRGRVPVRVVGPVRKGQTLVSGPDGTASVGEVNRFAIALESKDTHEEGNIEVVIL